MSWIDVSSNVTAVAGNSYFCNGTSVISVTLPSSASQGDTFTIYANEINWLIPLSSAQQLRFGSYLLGSGSSLSSSSLGDTVTITYSSVNGIWQCTNYQGQVMVSFA